MTVTDTIAFGGHVKYSKLSTRDALVQLVLTSEILWENVLKDQFVHKEFGPFMRALLVAKAALENEETSET